MKDWYVELHTLTDEQMLKLEEAAEYVMERPMFSGYEDIIGWRQPIFGGPKQFDYWGYNTIDFGGSKRISYEDALSILESAEEY